MRVLALALLATLSTACITLKVDLPDDMEFARTPRGTWKLSKPTNEPVVAPSPVSGHSRAIVKAPRKAGKVTADVCKAKHEDADKCDAQVKVAECKAQCEPPATDSK